MVVNLCGITSLVRVIVYSTCRVECAGEGDAILQVVPYESVDFKRWLSKMTVPCVQLTGKEISL